MAQIVMVMGQSGTGKSTSLRNFKKGEASIINVSNKMLPFACELPVINTNDYEEIKKLILKSTSKAVVIDDATYLIVEEYMRNAKLTGYQKYTDMALNFWNLLQFCIREVPNDKIIYFLGHTEVGDDGREHFKTVGKMLDNTVVPEGYFTVVLKTCVKDGRYLFLTHNSGQDTVKSPIGMFEETEIDNDLRLVDQKIRQFYKMESAPKEKAAK